MRKTVLIACVRTPLMYKALHPIDMTITINLPDDTITAVRAEADVQGLPMEQVAAECLAAMYAHTYDEEGAV